MACFCYYSEKDTFLKKLATDPQTEVEDYSIFEPYRGPIDAHPMLQEDGAIVTVSNNPGRSWIIQIKREGYRLVPIL
jgi:hypothetical protein